MKGQTGNKLLVGIVGCGLIGNKRGRVIMSDTRTSLCCAADVSLDLARKLLSECGSGNSYQDWEIMLAKEELDIVIAATPNVYLKEIVVKAAQKKIHVLCEKPLGKNVLEAEVMLQVARENNVVLKTGFNHRYHPGIFKAHQVVSDGVLGEPYYARCVYGHGGRPGYEREWRASKDLCGGGELLDQGVHIVDLFRWFMGEFEETYSIMPTYYWDMDVEDNAFAYFKTKDGQIASMHTSWTQWKNQFTFEIFGETGYLKIEGLGGSYGKETLQLGLRPREVLDIKDAKVKGAGDSGTKYAGGAPVVETFVYDGEDLSWDEEWNDFLSAISEKREPLGSGLDGLKANRMIEAAYLSAKENMPVKIN